MESDARAVKAAAFLAQALGLEDDPIALAADLAPIDLDPTVAVFAAELDSSIGPAAFLLYLYALAAPDADGQTGRDRFEAALATLQTAAERDAPGPRVVAHAVTDDDGFVLATTPATLRALRGDAAPERLAAGTVGPSPTDPLQARRAAADALLRLLRAADAEATAWLRATEVEPRPEPDEESGVRDGFNFTPEETELALFLLDDLSIRDLLRVLNVVLATAREQALAVDEEGREG